MRSSHRDGRLAFVLASVLLVSACGGEPGTSTAAIAAAGSGATGGVAGSPGAAVAGSDALGSTAGAGAAGAPASSGGMAGSAGNGTGGLGGAAASGNAGGGGSSGTSGSAGAAGASGTMATSGTGGVAGSAGTGGMAGASGTGGSAGQDGTPPKKFCGNITTGGMVRTDFIEHWDQITPENEGKWGEVERARDDMGWERLDAVYAYAKDHDIPFKQHTFVWGSQQPGWIAGLSQAEQRAEVEEWIRLFCERYPDTQLIDVVNEPPPHTTPSYAAALGGAGASGYDWIVQSFKWARQYCPNAILILNDYNTIEYDNDTNHFIDIVNRVKDAGAPIDAIGAQAHAAYRMSTSSVKTRIDKLAATGLPVYISEYDIDLADDNQQRQVMESQFTMFWDHEKVAGITLWGYVEGRTWLANSGLMTSGGQMRPAMTWLTDFLDR